MVVLARRLSVIEGVRWSPRMSFDRKFWLLDGLVDAPSSFAASLVSIRKVWGDAAKALSVDDHLALVEQSAAEGLIEVRLHDDDGAMKPLTLGDWTRLRDGYRTLLANLESVSVEDVSYDPVGLWMALTPTGRRCWVEASGVDAARADRSWTADVDMTAECLVARATSLDAARKAAAELSRNARLGLDWSSESVSTREGGNVEVRYRVIRRDGDPHV